MVVVIIADSNILLFDITNSLLEKLLIFHTSDVLVFTVLQFDKVWSKYDKLKCVSVLHIHNGIDFFPRVNE